MAAGTVGSGGKREMGLAAGTQWSGFRAVVVLLERGGYRSTEYLLADGVVKARARVLRLNASFFYTGASHREGLLQAGGNLDAYQSRVDLFVLFGTGAGSSKPVPFGLVLAYQMGVQHHRRGVTLAAELVLSLVRPRGHLESYGIRAVDHRIYGSIFFNRLTRTLHARGNLRYAYSPPRCYLFLGSLFWDVLICFLLHSQVHLNMELSGEDFKLLPGERSMPLLEYRKDILPWNLLLSNLPPGQAPGTHYPARLCPGAQRVFFLCIRMIRKLVFLRRLPASIAPHDIVMTLPDYRPKLATEIQLTDGITDQQVTEVVSQLADVFLHLIRVNDFRIQLPDEVYNLLFLMTSPRTTAPRTQPDLPLMQVHSSLVPMENRGELFVRIFQYIFHVLRVYEPSTYRFVMKELVSHKYWEILAGLNTFVEGLLRRGHYDPVGAVVVSSQGEHLKLNRHAPCHALEDAAGWTGPHGLRHTFADINHALYLGSDMLIASIMNSLNLMGHLHAICAHTLFPWEG